MSVLRRTLIFGAVGLVSAIWLVMTEIDSLLRTIQSSSGHSFGMSAVKGLPGDTSTAGFAIDLWNSGTKGDFSALSWVVWYVVGDSVIAAALAAVAVLGLVKLYKDRKWWILAIVAMALDWFENLIIWFAVQGDPAAPPNTTFLFGVTIAKWIVIGVGLLVLVTGVVVRLIARDLRPKLPSVLWQFRTQVAVLAVLAFFVAWPSPDRLGMLQQLPDITRSYADDLNSGDVATWLPSVAVVLLGQLFLVAAVWVSGHWLPFVTPPAPGTPAAAPVPEPVPQSPTAVDPPRERWSWRREALWVVLGLALAVLVGFARWPQPGLALLLVLVLVGAVHALSGRGRPGPVPPLWSHLHAFTLNALSVGVVAIAGLSLVRGFAALMLLPQPERAAGTAVLFVFGIVTAAGIAPLLFYGLSRLNRSEWDAQVQPRPVGLVLSVAIILASILTAVVFIAWPLPVGATFGADNLLIMALGGITVAVGGAMARARRSTPLMRYRDDQPDGSVIIRPVALPTTVLLLVVVTVVGRFDAGTTYHDAQYAAEGGSARPGTVTLEAAFDSWRRAAGACHAPGAPSAPRMQPMVFVAAAGGGIRAAFWTEAVLDELTRAVATRPGQTDAQATACARDAVFLVSSASGGSVGTSLWASDDGQDQSARARGASLISDGSGLGALTAGFVFRDTARSWLGRVAPDWPDRAALLERSWNDRLDGTAYEMTEPFLDIAGPDGAAGPWRPLLMLNSTDLLTQCRVVLTKLAPRSENPLSNCDDSTQAEDTLPGTYYVTDFDDTSTCGAQDRPMSTATAALLSGRFPFVTPTGTLYGCGDGENPRILQLADGGYLENSGILTAIQQLRAVVPMVADHNRAVLSEDTTDDPTLLADAVIVPTMVVIGNSYRSERDTRLPDPRPESFLPLGGNHAEEALTSPPRLEAEALDLFCTQVPGIDDEAVKVEIPCETRFHVFAPRSRPEISAPLGWALSEQSRSSLLKQLEGVAVKIGALRTAMVSDQLAAVQQLAAPAQAP